MAYTESNPISIGNATKKSHFDTLWANVAAIWAGLVGKVTVTQPATGSTLTIAEGKTLTCTQDTSLDEAVAMSSKAPKASPVFTGNVTLSGNVVNTTLPGFFALKSAATPNTTGTGTEHTVICNTETYDQAANYDNSTGIFTAPVTGKYHFDMGIYLNGCTIATTFNLILHTSLRTYYVAFESRVASALDKGLYGSVLANMNATDIAYFTVSVSGEAADTVDVYGAASAYTFFSGYLVF